jgi:hypothetical protein
VGRTHVGNGNGSIGGTYGDYTADKRGVPVTAPATPEAAQWAGFGTALKPCIEPWILVRKPLSERTIAANVLRWGTGALNIDACRYGYEARNGWPGPSEDITGDRDRANGAPRRTDNLMYGTANAEIGPASPLGRWPANVFACAKASRSEREKGCSALPAIGGADAVGRAEGSAGLTPRAGAGAQCAAVRNHHPCVKPVKLMRWLCRLVTPPGGTVLDPFMGSGTCGIAAALEGFGYLGIELDEWSPCECTETPHKCGPRARGGASYMEIASARIRHAATHLEVATPVAAPTPEQVTLWG